MAPTRRSFAPASVRRSWKTPSQSRAPGRNSRPNTAVTAVSFLSRSFRIPFAARQCSTMVRDSVPKDWMRAPRPPPRVLSWTARANASPRFGSISENLPLETLDLCHSLSALRISSTGLSR